MNKRFIKGVVALVAAVSLLATACGSDEAAVGSGDCDSVDSVSLQLQWVTQAQFAYHSFGGWNDSLFGDTTMYGPEGLNFFTRPKVITSRWPDPTTSQVDLGFPQNN